MAPPPRSGPRYHPPGRTEGPAPQGGPGQAGRTIGCPVPRRSPLGFGGLVAHPIGHLVIVIDTGPRHAPAPTAPARWRGSWRRRRGSSILPPIGGGRWRARRRRTLEDEGFRGHLAHHRGVIGVPQVGHRLGHFTEATPKREAF